MDRADFAIKRAGRGALQAWDEINVCGELGDCDERAVLNEPRGCFEGREGYDVCDE